MNKTRAPKIYFITYGDQKYSISKRHLIGLAVYSKFFDHSISFGPKDIDNSFKIQFDKVLSQQEEGFGYGNITLLINL